MGDHLPCPEASGWKDLLHKRGLIAIEANEVSSGKDIHHDAEGAEGQAADRKVASPPCAQAHKEQVVYAGEN